MSLAQTYAPGGGVSSINADHNSMVASVNKIKSIIVDSYRQR